MENESKWLAYAKEHKKEILNNIIGTKKKEESRRAILLAGGPASGKSELRKYLLEVEDNICVIDTDEFRKKFPHYNGRNAVEYQRAASYLTDFCFSKLIAKKYSIILDTTFASSKAIQNLRRLLDHKYKVDLYYVYQNPLDSWKYVKKRDRMVPMEVFKKTTEMAFKNVRVSYLKFKENPNFTLILQNQKKLTGIICNDLQQLEKAGNILKINWGDIYADKY